MVKVDGNTLYFINKTWKDSVSELDQYLINNNINIQEVYIESSKVNDELRKILSNIKFIKPDVSIIDNKALLKQHKYVIIRPDFKHNFIKRVTEEFNLYVATDLLFLFYSVFRNLELLLVHIYGLSGLGTKSLMKITEDDIYFGSNNDRQKFSKWLITKGIELADKLMNDSSYIIFNAANVDKLFYYYANFKFSKNKLANIESFYRCLVDLSNNLFVQRTSTLTVFNNQASKS